MIELPPGCDVLLRPVFKPRRRGPRFERIARILREVWRSRRRRRTVDRRQQHEIPPRIVDLPAAERQSQFVAIEPHPVVEHESEKILLWPFRGIRVAAYAATVLAADVSGQRKCHLADRVVRLVVILDLNAVIAVITHTSP